MIDFRPTEAPLDMPEQALVASRAKPAGGVGSTVWPKLIVILASLMVTIWLVWLMFRVLNVSGMTALEWGLLGVFTVNIAWISFAFASALAGFLVSLFGRRIPVKGDGPFELSSRTAILFPIYNESVEDVFATVDATAKALSDAAPGAFECFILSDTVNPQIALEEEAAFRVLKARSAEACPVFYRRRTMNVARKAGNVHDFVERWGGRYDHMIIFDADSYMETNTLVELARRMENEPDTGLIQTIPKLIGGESLFARVQQFAGDVYGPVLGRGIAFWSQNEGNYWGHNAIIRTRAFAQAAGLPFMPGRAPFGGHILSHDFVEAALLRRAGWAVKIAPELAGSYEEGPQTLIDLSIRDRRWCQGNLQHTAVLALARGITPTNRMHFMIGIMSYLASPLWLLLILIGMALSLQNRFLRPEYFSGNPSLTPSWPVIDPALALNVFFATMAILLLPKVFGVIGTAVRRRGVNGSAFKLIPACLLETLISALVAPIMMAAQTSSVFSILSGQDAGWTPQQRGSGGYRLADIARRHAMTTLLGLGLTFAALLISPVFAAWLLPATLGMILSIPLSSWLSRGIERDDYSAEILSTPEMVNPPSSFARALDVRKVYADVQPPSVHDIICSTDWTETHARLVDTHWALDGHDVHVPLAIAAAKLDRSHSIDDYLASLKPKELMAFLNAPSIVSRAEERFDQKNASPA